MNEIIEPIELTEEEIKVLEAIEFLKDKHRFVPSFYEHHLSVLPEEIISILSSEQVADVVRLMQAAYRNGQASQGAEKIDIDAVWVDDVGMIERQPDNTWIITGYDAAKDAAMIQARDEELGIGYTIEQYNDWAKSYHARQLGAIGGSSTSERKAAAARINGRKGGRPRNVFASSSMDSQSSDGGMEMEK